MGYLLPSCHPAASCMVDMKGEGFAEAATVVESYSSSCKGTAVVESQAVEPKRSKLDKVTCNFIVKNNNPAHFTSLHGITTSSKSKPTFL